MARSSPRHIRGIRFRFWLLLVLVFGFLVGCGRDSSPTPRATPDSADEVLQAMIGAYQSARAYRDEAVVRLQYRRHGQPYQDEAVLAVTWRAPDQLALQAYETRLACDGKSLRARIRDEATHDFDNQVVERAITSPLTLDEICEHDPILSVALRQGLVGLPLQLDLLLAPKPLAVFLDDSQVTRTLLSPQPIEQWPCYRVQIQSADGDFVLWIDQSDFLLRRVEYPVAAFAADVAADPGVEQPTLTVEFLAARFDSAIGAGTFALEVPETAHRVRQFIPLPRELPSELFGKQVADFSFRRSGGGAVTSQDMAERIKVLVWFNNHPACQATMQQLSQVHQQYANQDGLEIWGICVEPMEFSDDQLAELLQLWQVRVPVARDVQALGRDMFQIPWAPTMVILDARNTVQIFEVGMNPNLVVELPQVLERLLRGDDLASEIRAQFRGQQEKYAEALRRGEPLPAEQESESGLPSATRPQVMRLRDLWTNDQLQAAGNILAVDAASGQTRYLVLDGWRTVAEIDSAGARVASHELGLPKFAAVSQLRSARDRAGQPFYLAWSLQGPQVHLFDAHWRRKLSYPPSGAGHDGVQDAALVDLTGDRQPELVVGYWGRSGVEAVSLDGTPIWNTHAVSHVTSITPVADHDTAPQAGQAVATPIEKLWIASASGILVSLTPDGQPGPAMTGHGQLIHLLFHQPAVKADPPFCGVSYGLDGRRLVTGLSPDLQTRWRYNLPSGSFAHQTQFVVSGPLLGTDQPDWVIAGTDGSVHIVRPDGRFTDRFYTGAAITGLAVGCTGDRPTLVVASPDGLRAWEVLPPATASADP